MHVINIALGMSLPWTVLDGYLKNSTFSKVTVKVVFDRWLALLMWDFFFIAAPTPTPTPHLCGYWDERWRGEICFNTRVWSYSATVQLNTLLSELELGDRDLNSPMLVTAFIILIWVVILVYWESKSGCIISQFNNNEDHDAFRFFCQIQCCERL